MIIELNKSIIEKIRKAVSQSSFKKITITPEDLNEPITRPSIKVDLEDITQSRVNPLCVSNNVTVRIYFFAKDGNRPKLDNLAMQKILFEAFREPIEILASFFEAYELEAITTDGVLVVSFSLEYLEQLPQKSLQDMETLSISLKEVD